MLRREYKDINVSDSPFDNYLDLVEQRVVVGNSIYKQNKTIYFLKTYILMNASGGIACGE